DVDGLSEPDDGTADELAGAVPRDAAPAVDVDDLGSVRGSLPRCCALAGRVDGLVLDEQERVTPTPVGDSVEHRTLLGPRLAVGLQRRAQSELDDLHGFTLAP